MTSTAVLACEMMAPEIRSAMADAGLDCPVVWLERELHNYPDRLRSELQSSLDGIEADTVLLAFTQCGNAAVGLEARRARLVLPRFADCAHLLRSQQPGSAGEVEMGVLYLFPGTLEQRGGLFKDYDRCCARYGPEKGLRVCRQLVKNYRAVSFMDTGAADPSACEAKARELAELLALDYETCGGTTRVLRKLFSGQWDGEFVVVPRGGTLEADCFAFRP